MLHSNHPLGFGISEPQTLECRVGCVRPWCHSYSRHRNLHCRRLLCHCRFACAHSKSGCVCACVTPVGGPTIDCVSDAYHARCIGSVPTAERRREIFASITAITCQTCDFFSVRALVASRRSAVLGCHAPTLLRLQHSSTYTSFAAQHTPPPPRNPSHGFHIQWVTHQAHLVSSHLVAAPTNTQKPARVAVSLVGTSARPSCLERANVQIFAC